MSAHAHKNAAHYVSLKFQLIVILISICALVISVRHPAVTFHSLDPKPSLISIMPADIKRFGGQPSPIKVGFVINDFSVFDTLKGDFELKGIVWFEFDPSAISLSTLEQFSFERAESLEKSSAHTKIINDSTIFVWYSVKARFTFPLQYNYFPFDDHQLFFVLTNNQLSPNEVQLVTEPQNFVFEANISSLGWHVVQLAAADGYRKESLSLNDQDKIVVRPIAVFSISVLRSSIRHSLAILLPLLLIFFLSLGSLSIDYEKYPESVISLPIGSITGLLAYQFVIQSLSPSAGYFMLSDIMFFVILAAIFCIFFFSIFISQVSVLLKKIFIIGIHTVVNCIFIYFFFFWVK